MTANQKVYLFAGILIVTAVSLWGVKGLTALLPGPNAK